MEQLVQELIAKAGLNQEQAEKAIEVIKEYIMGQVPPMFGDMVQNFFKSNDGAPDLQGLMGKFGM